ncbi:MAG: hypothetical protein RLZZ08_1012 [Pseudomonadota bacterium]|jgi:hypothetical protein
MKTISKAVVGTIAAGAAAFTSVAPAAARDYRDRRHDGVDAGDIIAGALVIGGIAAIASAAGSNRYDNPGYDRGYDDYRGRDQYRGYDRGRGYQDPRAAVEQCVYAAERNASGSSWGGRAKVTDIRDVDAYRDGYRVKGRIAVNSMGRDWRRGDDRYGRGWDNDYRGWNDRYAGYDAGRFTCEVRYGRVVNIDYSGVRGL